MAPPITPVFYKPSKVGVMLFDLGVVHNLFWNFQMLLFLPLRITSNDKRFLLA